MTPSIIKTISQAAKPRRPGSAKRYPGDDRIFAKCAWRLIPFIALLYLINFLDRVNVGFAALTMNHDLGFSPSVYGIGAGSLFVGYLLFQVPGSLAVERFGARRTVFWIMASWGVISASCAFVRGRCSYESRNSHDAERPGRRHAPEPNPSFASPACETSATDGC